MKYVLTGDSGMLGSVLDHVLRARGHERVEPETSLPWHSPSTGEVEPNFATQSYWQWLRESEWDVLVHAGALVGTTRCESTRGFVLGSNVDGPRELAAAAADRGRRMVYFASEAEFAPEVYDCGLPIDLYKTPRNPRSLYGFSKLEGRRWVESVFARARNLLLVVYPCFGFGGVRDGTSCVAEYLKSAAGVYDRQPLIPLDPERVKEVTPHAFIAELVCRAITAQLSGRIPAASGSRLTFGQVVDVLSGVVGPSPPIVDWRPGLDYKGDLVYDPEATHRTWDLLGMSCPDLESAFAIEFDLIKKNRGAFATHDWNHLHRLEEAARG